MLLGLGCCQDKDGEKKKSDMARHRINVSELVSVAQMGLPPLEHIAGRTSSSERLELGHKLLQELRSMGTGGWCWKQDLGETGVYRVQRRTRLSLGL